MTAPKHPPKCWCGWSASSLRNPASLAVHARQCLVAQAAQDAYRQAIARRQPHYAHDDAAAAARQAKEAQS